MELMIVNGDAVEVIDVDYNNYDEALTQTTDWTSLKITKEVADAINCIIVTVPVPGVDDVTTVCRVTDYDLTCLFFKSGETQSRNEFVSICRNLNLPVFVNFGATVTVIDGDSNLVVPLNISGCQYFKKQIFVSKTTLMRLLPDNLVAAINSGLIYVNEFIQTNKQ